MEIENNDKNSLYNQIKYFTYDDQKKELDLNFCREIETQIHYAIKENSNLEDSALSYYRQKGVDILNIKDDFFKDLCYSYSESNKDMILEDRIKYIYKNYSLCEEGCNYNKLEIETMTIVCNCKIQGNFSSETSKLVFDEPNEVTFLNSNIGVVKCYNLVFSLNNKINNIGFIAFAILFLIYLITLFCFIARGTKPISDFLEKGMQIYGYSIKKSNMLKTENIKRCENNKGTRNKLIAKSIKKID